jgi:hypothetical protein
MNYTQQRRRKVPDLISYRTGDMRAPQLEYLKHDLIAQLDVRVYGDAVFSLFQINYLF